MTNRGLLIVVSGPSGVGKDTILKAFMPQRNDTVLSISAATRAPRRDEMDGVHYHFMSRSAFEEMIARDEMLEYAEFAGNYYGTPKTWVESQLAAGKHVILEIELKGARKIREKCPDAVFIFLMPPSMQVLRERLTARGTETPECIEARLEVAKTEIRQVHMYQYVIVNNTVAESCDKLDAVITAAACATQNMKDFIQEVCDNA